MRRLAPIAALVVSSFFLAGSATAQSPAASAAETLFREGKTLAAAQRYDEAIAKFRASQELEASVGVLLSLGDAYRARGKVASAWSAYVSAKSLAESKSDPRVTDAELRAASVRARLPRLIIRVASTADVSVTDNGLPLPPASFGSALPVDPGSHEIVASAKGRRSFRVTEDLTEGQSRAVAIPALEIDPIAPDDASGNTQRTVGTGLVIGGAASAVIGLVLGSVAISKWNTVTSTCPNRLCDTAADRSAVHDDATAADTFAVASTITVAVGVVALAAGLVLRMTAPSKAPASTSALAWSPGTLGGTFP